MEAGIYSSPAAVMVWVEVRLGGEEIVLCSQKLGLIAELIFVIPWVLTIL